MWCYTRGDIWLWEAFTDFQRSLFAPPNANEAALTGLHSSVLPKQHHLAIKPARIAQAAPQTRPCFAASCTCSSSWQSEAEQNLAQKVETAVQSIKVMNLYILIVSRHALLHTTSKINAFSCCYLRKPSMTVAVQIILFYFTGFWTQRNWKKKVLLERSHGKVHKQKKIKRRFYWVGHHSFYSCDNEHSACSTIKLVVVAHGRTAYIFSSMLFQDVFFCGK